MTPESVSLDPPECSGDIANRLLGAHMPTAGGLHKSLRAGKAIGCNAVQLFTCSPRQWSHSPLNAVDIDAFHAAREETGIEFTCAHDSYLINLAAPASDILERSRAAFRGELDRAELLGIPWVVTHMGAHLDQGEELAVARLIESLRLVLEETDALGYRVGVAMETTAGQGTGLGWRFEQLGEVLRGAGAHPRLGICLDTCHIFVAGYDLRTDQTYAETWRQFDEHIGLDRLKVIHANDARKALGSRVDRHHHIGDGEIGADAFGRLLCDPKLNHIPIIIETPDLETMHHVNLARIRRLASGRTLRQDVRVQMFGHYTDIVGQEPFNVSVPFGTTIGGLGAVLMARDERLADVHTYCRFAVGEEYVSQDLVMEEGITVAIMPPMSGG